MGGFRRPHQVRLPALPFIVLACFFGALGADAALAIPGGDPGAAQLTTTTVPNSATNVSVAWVTVIGVLGAGALSFTAAVLVGRSQLKGVAVTAEASTAAAFRAAQAQLESALTAARAQQRTVDRQLELQREAQLLARLDQLADQRRERCQGDVEATQDAVQVLAELVDGLARARCERFDRRGIWVVPPAKDDWEGRIFKAQMLVIKLLQRLPPGEGEESPEDQTWRRVKVNVRDLCEAVVDSRTVDDQKEALKDFKASVVAAQNDLGLARDRLDRQLFGRLPHP